MLCRYIFVCALLVTSAGVFLERNYGNYEIKFISYILHSYKPFIKVSALHRKLDNGTAIIKYDAVVSKDVGVLGVKVRWFVWDESLKKYSLVVNVAMRNACDKQIAKEVLALIPGLGKDCELKAGIYNFTLTDFDGVMHALTNGKFFYGNYRTITDVFTNKCGKILKVNATFGVNPI